MSPAPQPVAPDTGLILLLRRVESLLRRRLQADLAEVGLSQEHWRIMSFLVAHPGSRMAAIGDAAALPSASLTRHIDKLVELGIVVRRVDPDDRRSSVVALSPRGGRIASSLRRAEGAVEEELEDLLGPELVAALRHALALAPDALR